ncbi:MAG: hypothetical protein RLY86_36 [Pseudomonadota bacterium]|jgi:type VI secretion system protein ImpG
MTDDLFRHYETELQHLREAAAEFRRRNPRLAGRLELGPDGSADPHVERLLQGFALVAARLQRRLDDNFSHLSAALLESLYPQLVRPTPTRMVVQMELPAEDGPMTPQPVLVPRGTELLSRPLTEGGELRGMNCRFRTVFHTVIAPVTITDLRIDRREAPALGDTSDTLIRIDLSCRGDQGFDGLPLDSLRLHIHEEARLAFAFYELLLGRMVRAWAVPMRADGDGPSGRRVPVTLRPAGFDSAEAMLPTASASVDGYRLLLEYFSFPEKFLFFDVEGLRAATRGTGNYMRLEIEARAAGNRAPADQLARMLRPQSLRLGCTPVINLFSTPAEPIRLDHRQTRLPVVVDQRRPSGYEVIDVESVVLLGSGGRLSRQELPPLYARHRLSPAGTAPSPGGMIDREIYWSAERTQAPDGADAVDLIIADRTLTPERETDGVLLPTVLASNRNAAALIPSEPDRSDFLLGSGTAGMRISRLGTARPVLRLAQGAASQWRLVSHLAANRLCLADGGIEGLRGLLSVYAPTDGGSDIQITMDIRSQIRGLTDIRSTRVLRSVGSGARRAPVDGTDIELEFDETAFLPGGAYLFSAILDRFFASFAAANSFTRLTARSRQRQQEIAAWMPRIGLRPLV